MDRLKKSRTPIRTTITKTVNDVDVSLAEESPSLLSLQRKLDKLDELLEKMEEIDDKIKEALLDDDCTPEELEEEATTVDDYRDKVEICKLKINQFFKSREPQRSPTPSEYSSAVSMSGQRRNFKLPKIELMKFNGDLKMWLGYWSQFKKIDEDETLHATDKFQYLIQSLPAGTEAFEIVNSYPQSTENYPKAVEALKERFGRESLLVQVYVRELLKLVITNVTKRDKIPLTQMYIKLESHLRALSSLNLESADPSTWLFPLVESSLPEEILRAWQRSPLSKKDGRQENPPKSSLDYLMEFIKTEVQSEQQIELAQSGFEDLATKDKNSRKTQLAKEVKRKGDSNIPTAAGLFSGHTSACIFCDKPHESKDCGKAQELSLEDKNLKIKKKNACFICLKTAHVSKMCKSFVKCIVCKKRHVTLMCPELHKKSEEKTEKPADLTHSNLNCTNTVMLQTLNIVLVNKNRKKSVRALCDPGAQKSYIQKKTAEELMLNPTGKVKLCHYLFGGSSEVKEHNKYNVQIESESGDGTGVIEVLDQKTICGNIPRMSKGPWMKELKENRIWVSDIGQATPDIELLIGSDYYGKILTGGKFQLENGLVALETIFGWTVSGKVAEETGVAMAVTSMHVQEADVSDLWNLELIGIQDPAEHKSKQEKEEEIKQNFLQTVTRSQDGRYCVKLPFIDSNPQIPTNRGIAESRLMAATRKLQLQGHFDTYNSIFEGWLTEGIIETVPAIENDGSIHYLPHRPVFKPNSLTTPVRPVFDASCKGKRTPSLNECIEKGPNLMELIPSILLRFRENKIGVISDIRKAFQMIEVDKKDQDYLRFLWWEDHQKKIIKTFRHKRVVFGVNCSPYLLAAVLEHHLTNVAEEDQVVAGKLLKALYVDNCVTSVHTIKEYQEFRDCATRILAEAKMELRQWEHGAVEFPGISHSPERCGLGNDSSRNCESENATSSVLGLMWDKNSDNLGCDFSFSEVPVQVTKRKILSATHKIFDPIGFSAPALIIPKLILQEAWAAELDWDEEMASDLTKKFLNWYEEIKSLKMLAIPRCINPFCSKNMSIHTFCDASKDAYAAVVYVRSIFGVNTTIRLLQAKARIAPLKRTKDKDGASVERRLSIPRLELMACTIGARLTEATKAALHWEEVPCYFWSDSTTALSWIHRNDDWGTFVGNRVREILKLTNAQNWRHVPGIHNPADLPSRGCSPSQLLESRWWEGPDWLLQPSEEWPVTEVILDEEEINLERKRVTHTMASSDCAMWFKPRFSTYQKNIRVMGWGRRFIQNAKLKKSERNFSPLLSIQEMRKAEIDVLRCVQEESLSGAVNDLRSLKVKMGSDGVYRVCSKLLYKADSIEFRNPIVLPKEHPIVEQLIHFVHITNCHAGIQFVLGRLREKYWILQGRRTVGKILKKCTRCKRHAVKSAEVESAPLPANRVEATEAYQATGVDLAGPLFLKDGGKAWIVLFTCAVYRAIHLDLVTSLSTEAFLGALERFINIHGRPNVMYSDNGTNFVGAVNLFKLLDPAKIEKECRVRLIQWIFNPPAAPWYGGFWERLIRSVKDLLRRMLGRAKLTYDDLRTCLSAVEATINNRPLTTITEDDDDLVPLTPAMFTRGMNSYDFPEGGKITTRDLQSCYKSTQKLKEDLQARFRREYLGLLVQKSKEKNAKIPEVGDVVLVGADNKKRFEWPMARVLELITGKDGHIRIAKVKTATGILTRPLQRLHPLEIPRFPDNLVVSPEVKKLAQEKKREKQKVKKQIMESAVQEADPDPGTITKSGRKTTRPRRYGQWN